MKRTGILTIIMGNMKRSWIPILIIPALVIAAVLLAYGPAGVGSAQAQDDSTDDTTTTPAPKYPNLDATLTKIVAGYEDETWTETQAAQQAPEHHGAMVLIAVDVTAAQADSVNTWMGTQEIEPRFLVGDIPPPYIYAYAKVSLLGALSGQDGVTRVRSMLPRNVYDRPPRGVSGQDGSLPKPKLPVLSGYPYPRLAGGLQKLLFDYDNGLITADRVAEEASRGIASRRRGNAVQVNVQFLYDETEERERIVLKWLQDKGVQTQDFWLQGASFSGHIPVTLLGELSWQPGIFQIAPIRRRSHTGSAGGFGLPPLIQKKNPAQQSPAPTPTPTPTPVVSQGVSAHGAASKSWTDVDGTDVKIGIIDEGFENWTDMADNGDLPLIDNVARRCYAADNDETPSSSMTECTGGFHGTQVAMSVYDMADGAALYISNSARLRDGRASKRRLKDDVKWMIQEGVDIINYSVLWGLYEDLGDGEVRYRSILDASRRGPTTDGRIKPDVVGVDCAKTFQGSQELVPGASTAETGTNCYFWGTSQAPPHIAGLAVRILEKYDDPNDRQYGAADVADWIKETAVQRITTEDPDNTWGYGFAFLPNSPPTASLAAKPGTLNVTRSISPTLTATNVGTGVTVSVNRDGDIDAGVTADEGNLSLDGDCPGDLGANTSTTSSGTVQLKGCVPGEAWPLLSTNLSRAGPGWVGRVVPQRPEVQGDENLKLGKGASGMPASGSKGWGCHWGEGVQRQIINPIR